MKKPLGKHSYPWPTRAKPQPNLTMPFAKGGKPKPKGSKKRSNVKSTRTEYNKVTRATNKKKDVATESRIDHEVRPSKRKRKRPNTRKTAEEVIAEGGIPILEEWVRVYCVMCYLKRYNEPDEGEWGTIANAINKEVGCSVNTVKRVFRCIRDRDVDSALMRKAGSGAKRKLPRDNPGLIVAAIAINIGVPPELATMICNAKNFALDLKDDNGDPLTVCRNTLMDTLREYTDVKQAKIQRRKTGSKDPNSKWAKTRVLFCAQLKRAFELGFLLDEGKITWEECEITPLWIESIVQIDECHQTCTIAGSGHSGQAQTQYRIALDEETMELKKLEHGGAMPPIRERVVPKYASECRGIYGVAMPKDKDTGKRNPQMMLTQDYTEKKMLSVKAANKKLEELAPKYKGTWDSTKGKWKGFNGGKDKGWLPYAQTKNPFKARYGSKLVRGVPRWQVELKKTPSWNKWFDIRDAVQHMIDEAERLHENSVHKGVWMIYHDHLNILWEKETIVWLKSMPSPHPYMDNCTYYDRFIKLEGKWNKKAPDYYKNKLPGDSPELMALDNHLFSDIKEGVARNIAMSFHLPKDHPDKYLADTPDHLFQSIERTIINDVPTVKRIEEDMVRIRDETLGRIMAAHGCYIEDKAAKKEDKKKRPTRKGNRRDAQRLEQKKKMEATFSTLDKHLVDHLQNLKEDIVNKKVKLPFDMVKEEPEKKSNGPPEAVAMAEGGASAATRNGGRSKRVRTK
jgi:hypothetical protein